MNQKWITEIKENTEFYAADKTKIQYILQSPEYQGLKEQYPILAHSGENDKEKAFNLLSWVNRHVRHRGSYDNSDSQDALTLLEIASTVFRCPLSYVNVCWQSLSERG